MENFRIQAKGSSNGEILIYGDVDDAKGFVEQLNSLGAVSSLDIRINSPGGSVFEGLAIFNGLERHRARKNVYVDGLAASIASLIAMAGQKITMAENSSMMIHNPYTVSMGDVSDMRKMADTLERIKESMVQTYVKKTSLSVEEISGMMDAETWMSAKEAVDLGFATEVSKPAQAQIFNLSTYGYRNAPVMNVSQGREKPYSQMTPEEKTEAVKKLSEEIDLAELRLLRASSPGERHSYYKKQADKALLESVDEQLAWARREGYIK